MSESADVRQVVGRRWGYAPPPWRMFEALTDERDQWLELLTDETRPLVIEAVKSTLVTFRPWLDPVIDSVAVEISDDGSGSSLRILATASVPRLPDEQRRWTRYRLGTIFGDALRDWVDQSHY